MERREEPRIKKRISCELSVGERRFSGLVLDLSAGGLFVQTAARARPGERVRVALSVPGRKEALEVSARVARARLVPPRLRTLAHGGVGLQLENAPQEYLEFVEAVKRPVVLERVSVLPPETPSPEPREKKPRLDRKKLDKFFRRAPAPRRRGEPGPSTAPSELSRFRVAVSEVGGAGRRSFIVRSASEQDAREQAARRAGGEWRVEGVEKL